MILKFLIRFTGKNAIDLFKSFMENKIKQNKCYKIPLLSVIGNVYINSYPSKIYETVFIRKDKLLKGIFKSFYEFLVLKRNKI